MAKERRWGKNTTNSNNSDSDSDSDDAGSDDDNFTDDSESESEEEEKSVKIISPKPKPKPKPINNKRKMSKTIISRTIFSEIVKTKEFHTIIQAPKKQTKRVVSKKSNAKKQKR